MKRNHRRVRLFVAFGLSVLLTCSLLLSACSPGAGATSAVTSKTSLVAAAQTTTNSISLTAGTMSISLDNRTIKAGDTITVNIMVDSQTGLRGIQCGLDFDPKLMRCDDAEEGPFLKKWAQSLGMSTMVVPDPVIDNQKGHVSKMVIVVTGRPNGQLDNPGTGATGNGIAATYSFTALANGQAIPKITDASLIAIPASSGGHAVEVPVKIVN